MSHLGMLPTLRVPKFNLNLHSKLSQVVVLDKTISATKPAASSVGPNIATSITMKSLSEVVRSARVAFNNGQTKSLKFREIQLRNLLRMYKENEGEMLDVLKKDLNKSRMEGVLTEVHYLVNDLKSVINNFKEWAKPEKATREFTNIMDEALIYKDPYGVVLIVGAWNYPIQLSLVPVAGAIAAGNTVIIKPSEVTTASADFIARTIPKYLDNDCYQVVSGGISEMTQLLKEKFDYIFFTGNTTVGKIVYAAASQYLTPVTLELGGKSPVYLDDTADVDVATRRILWGKCVNAGQTCIAPDYVLCSKEMEIKFLAKAKDIIREWYGDSVQSSPDLCRIVSDNHFKRLIKFLNNAKIGLGGKIDTKDKYIEPTILIDVKPTDLVMQEEIFGPILPVININDVSQAIKFINEREKPLASYIFSNNKFQINSFLENTTSGGVCVNDTLMHLTVSSLPFGGVGTSGIGAYHGKYTFDTFVHSKSTLIKNMSKFSEMLQTSRYPPYTDIKLYFLTSVLNFSKSSQGLRFITYIPIFSLGLLTLYLMRYMF